MKTNQDALEKGQKVLHRATGMLAKLAAEAGERADDMCRGGDNDASAAVRAMQADLLAAQSKAVSAYAKGRALKLPGVLLRSGDK
jgi:hypothetical protein